MVTKGGAEGKHKGRKTETGTMRLQIRKDKEIGKGGGLMPEKMLSGKHPPGHRHSSE